MRTEKEERERETKLSLNAHVLIPEGMASESGMRKSSKGRAGVGRAVV